MFDLTPYPTALVADCLDDFGLTEQVVDPALQLLVRPEDGRLFGRARTLELRVLTEDERFRFPPHEEAVEKLRWRERWGLAAGDVVVIGFAAEVPPFGIQGDLVSLWYQKQGVRGTVTSGYIRDLEETSEFGFPLVARGTSAANGRGRVGFASRGEPVTIGGVAVGEGEYVLADGDGCVIVPAATLERREFQEHVRAAAAAEDGAAEMVRGGATLAEAFERHRRL